MKYNLINKKMVKNLTRRYGIHAQQQCQVEIELIQ